MYIPEEVCRRENQNAKKPELTYMLPINYSAPTKKYYRDSKEIYQVKYKKIKRKKAAKKKNENCLLFY
ncbi:hypothetical protein, partial [uncultured Fusobacterium sp.]|uniref:hypothetical protein n=1 Tax=uncultured Fusobacterium sp. TaxID=159267 RepID=UPI0027DD7C5C